MTKEDLQNRLNEIENLAAELAEDVEEHLNECEKSNSPDKKFWDFASEYSRDFADDCADAAEFEEYGWDRPEKIEE